MICCTFTYGEHAVSEHTAFGIVDAKGRELGAHTRITPITVAFGPVREYFRFMALEPGVYFEVDVHTTRDGKPFGASHAQPILTTLDDARREAAARVAGARNRYAKRAAAGQKL